MTEPKRLIEEGTAFDRALLGAHRAERPSPDYERRVIAAAALASSAVVGAGARSSFLSRLGGPRLLAVAAALGVGAAMLAASRSDDARPPVAHTAPSQPPAAPASIAVAPPSEVLTVTTPDALPNVPAAAAKPSSATAQTPSSRTAENAPLEPESTPVTTASLQREVELLDAAKRGLRSGATAEASRALDQYESEFPKGSLRQEAGLLRLRLLLAKGDRARAAALGDELLRENPNTVHAKRIRSALAADGAEATPPSPR